MRKIEISPSILSANKEKIEEELSLARISGAKYIHLDVMDGKFVPAVTLSPEFVGKITPISGMINDVHIMVEKPWEVAPLYIQNGADIVTFHLEACKDEKEVIKTIDVIKNNGCWVGISIKPATDVKNLDKYLSLVDLVLIMSVEPGKGGQKFIPESVEKISYLRKQIDKNNLDVVIEVDGGINNETAIYCKEAGVDILVAGSYLYGHEDFIDRAKGLLN